MTLVAYVILLKIGTFQIIQISNYTGLKVSMFLQDWEFRNEAETTKNRVSWDTEMCCFLDAGGTARSATHTTHSSSSSSSFLTSAFQAKWKGNQGVMEV